MEGELSLCNLKSNYNYKDFINILYNKYGFEQIGEGGFGVILGSKDCAIKIIKDIKRCQELKREIQFYQTIDQYYRRDLVGKIPLFNLYHELNDYCQFNMERIYAPLLEYDDGNKVKAGYLLDDGQFKILNKSSITVNNSNLYNMSRRKLIHFYINHYDLNFKYRDDNKGDLFGLNTLVSNFTEKQVRLFSFAVGQLLAFLIFDCKILPFDIEVVVGTTNKDKYSKIYFLDFNECQFINNSLNTCILASEIARSMYSKDGKFYFPNNKNIFYADFVEGLLYNNPDHAQFISMILDLYNSKF